MIMTAEEADEPVLGTAPNTRLIDAYRRYPQAEQAILQVLSIVYQPITQTSLQRILNRLDWRTPDGAPLSGIAGKPLWERLLADGLITQTKNRLQCHRDVVEVLTRETVAAGLFEPVAKAAAAMVAVGERYGAGPGDPEQVRKLRLDLYAGNDRAVLKQLGLEDAPFSLDYHGPRASLVQICTRPFDRQWFDTLAPTLRFQVLAALLRDSSNYVRGSREAWSLMTAEFGAQPPDPEVAYFLAEQWLYRGDPGRVEALLPDDSPHSLTLLGGARFLQGRHDEAIAQFEGAIKATRKQTRRRNVHIPGLAGVCFLLALLRSGDPSHRELAQKQLLIAEKPPMTDLFEPVFRLLGDLQSILAGEMRVDQGVWLHRDSLSVEPWLDLFRGLALHWLGEKPRARHLARLTRYCEAAHKAGLAWYAREAALLLQKTGKEMLCAAIAGDKQQAETFQSVTDLFRPEAPWERTLRALKGVCEGGGDAGTSAQPGLRMVWRLYCWDHGCSLEPREQKRTKRGGWSPGRPVSLERLYKHLDSFDYLSEQDRRICRQIEAETLFEYYGGYRKIQYSLDGGQALSEAIGHPLLFWGDDPKQPVEMIRAEPVLEVTRSKGKLQLRLAPFPHGKRTLIPQREGKGRLRLVAFSAQHRRIADILGEQGVSVPRQASNQVLESVAAIAPLLTVHSEIGAAAGGETSSVAADPKLHVHLRPAGEGLAMECYVRPFGEAGPLLRPGEGAGTLFVEAGGKPLQTNREIQQELANASLLLDQCPELDPDAGWSWVLDEPESALDTLLRLQELGETVSLEWPQGQKIRLTPPVNLQSMQVSVRQQRDWFALEGELALSDEQVLSMKELLELLQQSPGRFVRLGEHEFLTLTKELRQRLEALEAIGEKGRFHPLASPAVEELTEGMTVKSAKAWRERLAHLAKARELQPEPPSTLQAQLRDYQLDGFRWLARLAHWGAGACLADDMGLGKTLQALALILTRAPAGPTLVLAPTSVCTNWLEEAARFAPTLKARRFGPGNRQQLLDQVGAFDLIVCSYGLLQTESERLAAVCWTSIVADEAQAFKNVQTKRSKAIMTLQADFRMIATGTPVENHLGELWNLFQFINPGLLGPLERFNRRFAAPIEQQGNRAARKRLQQLIRPFILRRLKSDVLTELPPRTEITLHVELSDEETALYEAMRQEAVEKILEESLPPGQRRVQILAEIMRLRRACCNPRLVMPASPIESAKLRTFTAIVEELRENRHKALVFSQFVGHLALIRAHLDERGIGYQYLDGATPVQQRAAAVDAFQAGEGELFLISLKAGGSGLNLTAADYVIHMDPWWNPAVEDQASDRAHRIGQQRPVTIYRLVARNTIEDKIVQLHDHKRGLADDLLEGSDLSGKMSLDEMMSLLKEGESG
jgi:superfamily II DNA or RNA helicase